MPRRYDSPSSSGLGSSGIGSSWSDRQGSPWSSPEMNVLPHPLGIAGTRDGDLAGLRHGGPHDMHHGGGCVALNDVQKYADHQIDSIAFEDDDPIARLGFYGCFQQGSYQEGYEPMMSEARDECIIDTDFNASIAPYPSQAHHCPQVSPRNEPDPPVFRRRRPQPSRSVTSRRPKSRVSKRIQPGRRSSHHNGVRAVARTEEFKSTRAGSTAFPCALQSYGCTSTFGSKNEWKRHIATQHMQLDSWRCEWCHEGKRKDFNRKDLFIQHVRRMHAEVIVPPRTSSDKQAGKDMTQEQAAVAAASDRCYRRLRSPPDDSRCLLCGDEFRGPGSWDERMEHLGRHLEKAKKGTQKATDPREWHVDSRTHEWLIEEGIVVACGRQCVLADKT